MPEGAPSSNPSPLQLAASYARKSDPDDLGIADQHQLIAEAAARLGYTIPNHPDYRFEDDDTTGAKVSRHGIDRLSDLITSGDAPFSAVISKDLTRFGRWDDPGYVFYYQVTFAKHGIALLFADMPEDYDPRNPTHFLRRAFDATFASEERKKIVIRTTTGVRRSVKRGFFPGSACFATERWYKCKRTHKVLGRVDENKRVAQADMGFILRWREDGTPALVREMFEWCADGVSLRRIAQRLENLGVPNQTGRVLWRGNMVRRILLNPLYMGDVVWGRSTRGEHDPLPPESVEDLGPEPILLKDFLPGAPVPRDLFGRVQEVLRGRQESQRLRKRKAPQYLLSGLVRCAECGGKYGGFTSSKKNRTRYTYYRHGHTPVSYKGRKCPHQGRYLRSEQLEGPLNVEVERLLKGDRLRNTAATALRDLASSGRSQQAAKEARQLQRQRKKIEGQLQNLIPELEDRPEGPVRVGIERRLAELETAIQELDRRIKELHRAKEHAGRLEGSLERLSKKARRLSELYRKADPTSKQAVLGELVDEIVVDPEQERITLRIVALQG